MFYAVQTFLQRITHRGAADRALRQLKGFSNLPTYDLAQLVALPLCLALYGAGDGPHGDDEAHAGDMMDALSQDQLVALYQVTIGIKGHDKVTEAVVKRGYRVNQ